MATDYQSNVFGKIDAECHLGHERHIMTSSAFNSRVLGSRLFRVVPAVSGHTGYTKQGIMLTRGEVKELHSFLTEAMTNEELWEEQPTDGVVPIKRGVESGD